MSFIHLECWLSSLPLIKDNDYDKNKFLTQIFGTLKKEAGAA